MTGTHDTTPSRPDDARSGNQFARPAETDSDVDQKHTPAVASDADVGQIRTLHVDDDHEYAEVTAAFLERADDRIAVATAHSARAGLELLASSEFDCIVSDYDMPGRNGIEFLEAVREFSPQLPFILFTGKGSEEVASEAISAGVTDYLQKEAGTDQYAVLANRIVNVVKGRQAETNLERRRRQHEAVANLGRDALEGVGVEQLLETSVELLTTALDIEYAKVLQRSADADELLLVAGTGWDPGLMGTVNVGMESESLAGYTLEQAEPVVVDDLRTEDRFDSPEPLTAHDVVSGISVIVGSTDDPWGVIGTHTSEDMSFSRHDVSFVQSISNVLAAAIEREETEQRLRESEARFREIAELSPDSIFRAAPDGTFRYVSPAAADLLAMPVDDIEGTNFRDLLTERSFEPAIEGFGHVLGGEEVRDLQLTLVDGAGEELVVEVSAGPVCDGGEVALVQGFARDVTNRIERERALRESEERYRTLVDHFPGGGVFLFDRALECIVAGGSELETVGITPASRVGKTPSDVYPAAIAEELETNYRAALDGETNTFEQTYKGNHYRVQTIPVEGSDGEIEVGMAVSQNVTEQREREEALRRQNEQLDEVASVVSHDLRNPLQVAQARVAVTRETDDDEHLTTAAHALNRIEALVDDLATVALEGRRTTAIEDVRLEPLLEDTWKTVATPAATLVTDAALTIRADRRRLEQLLENLFGNAITHAGEDVTVRVGTLADDGTAETVSDRRVEGFYVEDDGPGIPTEDRDRVFESGYSTNVDGTGFGLFIVETIATEHNWDITVTESASGGARFEITGVDVE